MKAGAGNEEPDGHPDSPSGTSRVMPAPGRAQPARQCHGHDGHPDDDGEAGLDAYVARLAAAAPPLSSQQRDTLALLLRRPRRR